MIKDERIDINATTGVGTTPFHLSAAYGTLESVQLFFDHASLNINQANVNGILSHLNSSNCVGFCYSKRAK